MSLLSEMIAPQVRHLEEPATREGSPECDMVLTSGDSSLALGMKWEVTADISDIERLTSRMAPLLKTPFVLSLAGELGAGKTTFVRALLCALGYTGVVKSPTFSVVETYFLTQGIFHHFDLYRILDVAELHWIGWRDYFTPDAICCIEWPAHAGSLLGPVDVAIILKEQLSGDEHERDVLTTKRVVTMEAGTISGQMLLTQLMD